MVILLLKLSYFLLHANLLFSVVVFDDTGPLVQQTVAPGGLYICIDASPHDTGAQSQPRDDPGASWSLLHWSRRHTDIPWPAQCLYLLRKLSSVFYFEVHWEGKSF